MHRCNGDAHTSDYHNGCGGDLAPQGHDDGPLVLFPGQALPLRVNHLVAQPLVGLLAGKGAAGLGHQRVEFAALIIGKDVLPLPLGVLLGMLKHLQQLFGLVHRSGGVNVKRSWSSALRRCL